MKIYYTSFHSKIGTIYVASTNKGVCKIVIPGQTKKDLFRWLNRTFPDGEYIESASQNKKIIDELQRYLERKLVKFRSKTQLVGTDFQINVWKELKKVRYGTTVTYKNLAEKLGKKNSYQAVGGANGSNPLPIVIPCHRVIGSNHKLVGYAAGLKTKEFLLRLEGAVIG